MRTFAPKPKVSQQPIAAKPAAPGPAGFGQNRAASSILHAQHTIGNRAVQAVVQRQQVPNDEGDAKAVAESVIDAMSQPNPIAGASDVDQAFGVLNKYSLPFLLRVLPEVYDRGYFHGLLGYLAPGTKANDTTIVAIRTIQFQREPSNLTAAEIREIESYLARDYARLPDELKRMADRLEQERFRRELQSERQSPGARRGSKTLAQGTMDWWLAPSKTYSAEDYRGQPSAHIQIMFTLNPANSTKTITFLQTVLQTTTSSASTKNVPLLDIGTERPFDPFYGADFSPKEKQWIPEEAPAGFKNAPSKAGYPTAYLYDGPSVPPTQTKMFESVVVVPATGEVLGSLKWGVSWGKGEGKVLGGEGTDCTEAPSADFGTALDRFYATPKTLDMKQRRAVGDEHYDAILYGFATNEAALTAEHQKQLDSVVNQFKEFPNLSGIVGGFADESEKDPLGISRQRAETVKNYLIGQGVPKDKILLGGFGASWARHPPSAKENRNRRVQILLDF